VTQDEIEAAAARLAEQSNGGKWDDPRYYAPSHRAYWRARIARSSGAQQKGPYMPINASPQKISDAIGKLIDTRGAVLIAFCQVEWFLAKLVTVAATYDAYKQLDLTFTQDAEKRAERLRQILKVDGPLKKFADVLSKPLDEVMSFAELRNFCAHGLLVRPADFGLGSKMHYRMFRMYKGGELKEETLDLTIKEYTEKEKALMAASKKFMEAVISVRTISTSAGR
jgi:hypothetical protein